MGYGPSICTCYSIKYIVIQIVDILDLGDIRTAPLKGLCMSKIRAVRLSPEEEKLVQSFLQKNPLFDFTTLVRAALREFMRRPQMNLTAVEAEEAPPPKRKIERKANVKEVQP
jgi:hypothetical protein